MEKYSNIPESVLERLSRFIERAGNEINPDSISFVANTIYNDKKYDEADESDDDEDEPHPYFEDEPIYWGRPKRDYEGPPGYLPWYICGGLADDPDYICVEFYDEDEILEIKDPNVSLWHAIKAKQTEIRLKNARPYIQQLIERQCTESLYGEYESNLYFDITSTWEKYFGYNLECYVRIGTDSVDDDYPYRKSQYGWADEIRLITTLTPQQIAEQDKKNEVHFLPEKPSA